MSRIEETFAWMLKVSKIEGWVREHRFHPTRRWRFDFAWPDRMLAVECEGGIWRGGRHTRGKGFEDDCVKYNEALLLGWNVLRVTSQQVKTGEAILWIERALIG